MSEPTILDVMAGLLADLPAPVRRELHVAEPVWRFLRHTYAKATSPAPFDAMAASPIVVDDDLTGGQWQIRENGEVVKSGDMAPIPEGMPEGTVVMYSPTTGWVAIDTNIPWPSAFRVSERSGPPIVSARLNRERPTR